jgi:flavin reductase (DIM6/NTAB) family NADH-FMN oxidoreductase RutF
MNGYLRFSMLASAALLATGLCSCTPAASGDNADKAKGANVNAKKSLGAKTIAATPVWCIGSYDKDGEPNVMTAAWVGICCSKPPCISVALRKATYTHGNITARKAFTASIPSEAFAKQADYFGLVSGKDTKKFAAVGLTPVKSELVDAPYVGEFPLVIECKLVQTVELGLHTLFVGEIVDVKADQSVLGPDGALDMAKVKPFFFDSSSRQYFKLGEPLGKAFEVGKGIAKPAK